MSGQSFHLMARVVQRNVRGRAVFSLSISWHSINRGSFFKEKAVYRWKNVRRPARVHLVEAFNASIKFAMPPAATHFVRH